MEEARRQSLEEDFEGQATHTGKQSQKKKVTAKLKLNPEISNFLMATIQLKFK